MSMWNENYRLGIDLIDTQHMQLFGMTERLLKLAEKSNGQIDKQEIMAAVSSFKDCIINHFSTEEAYQESIGYDDLDTHRMLHNGFVVSLLKHEKKMSVSNFSVEALRDFTGFLVSWMIYHVADADQKIAPKRFCETDKNDLTDSLYSNLVGVIDAVSGIGKEVFGEIKPINKRFGGDMSVKFCLSGDVGGKVVFVLSSNMANNLLESITPGDAKFIDEKGMAAISEITNIVMDNTVQNLSSNGKSCEAVSSECSLGEYHAWGIDGFYLSTKAGEMQVVVSLD